MTDSDTSAGTPAGTSADTSGLTILGSRVRGPVEHVEAFPAPPTVTRVRFTTDEVSSVCPVTGQPDISGVVIDYEPDQLCIESKSLKLYLWSFRDRPVFAEALAGRDRRRGAALGPAPRRCGWSSPSTPGAASSPRRRPSCPARREVRPSRELAGRSCAHPAGRRAAAGVRARRDQGRGPHRADQPAARGRSRGAAGQHRAPGHPARHLGGRRAGRRARVHGLGRAR